MMDTSSARGGTFEQRLEALVNASPHRPDPVSASIIKQLIDPGSDLLPWRNVIEVLHGLGVTPQAPRLQPLYQEALRRRRSASRRPADRPVDEPVPPPRRIAVEDAVGGWPNPLEEHVLLNTFGHLDLQLLEFHSWAGRPSVRVVAKGSGGAFSHGTVHNRLLGDVEPGSKPFSAKLDYVVGFIRGCGGSELAVRTYATAWRRVDALVGPSRNGSPAERQT
jgi:hypothetical protein